MLKFEELVGFRSAVRFSPVASATVKFSSNEISTGSALSSISTGIICSTASPTIVPSVTMADTFKLRGFDLVQENTDNHLILMDLRNKKVTGKEVEELLGSVNITVNKNSIPNDPESPFVTSGIRIGTPAITTRGFKNDEAKEVVELICDAIENKENSDELDIVKDKVKELCKKFPVYK